MHQQLISRPRRLRIGVAFASASALFVLAVSGAYAEQSYSDPAGDAGTAPDMTAIRATHDSAGRVTFTVATNQAVLPLDSSIDIYVDSDRNPATGLPIGGLGADHFFGHDGEFGGGIILHIYGNTIILDIANTLDTSYAAGTLTASIDSSDLDDPESFRFVVMSERDDGDDATEDDADIAPNGPPVYEYAVGRPLALTMGKAQPIGTGPVAGKRFVLGATVTRSDGQPFSTGRVTCTAKIGNAPVAASGAIANGAARCSLKVPKTAKGKRLRGSVTASTAGAAGPVTTAFSYRVR